MKNKSLRTCQVKGCFSCKSPIWQPVINVVSNASRMILGTGHLPAIICDDCRTSVRLKQLMNDENWLTLVETLKKHDPNMNTPSYDLSFLTFERIPTYTVH